VRFSVLAGTEYQIAVDGFDGESGDVKLSLGFLAEPIVRPANDRFANALTLTGAHASALGDNRNATREAGEPAHAGADGDTSVWWTWTAPDSGSVIVTTDGSDFDTLLVVYLGNTISTLEAVAGGDDIDAISGLHTSAVAFTAVAGKTYRIVVDGFDGSSGTIRLQLDTAAARMLKPLVLEGSVQAILAALPETRWRFEASEDLSQWTQLETVSVGTNGVALYVDHPTSTRRWYRGQQQ
jgi:hypothetical protein